MGRAAGSLLDANASGMIAALWTTGLLAFAGSRRARLLGVAGALLCWAGLWMTGSRTALLGGFIALAPVGLAVVRGAGGFRARRRELLAAGAAVVVVVGILLALPSKGPLDRLRYMPTFAGDEGVDWLIHEFWDRSSYGGAAAIMIGNHPATGIGLGMFHLMGADYIRVHLHEVPPDNAQNWWRHNLVEMGVVGAAGLLIWSALFVTFLARTAGEGERRVPAAALKGALVAIGLASLMGMPAQSLPVALTFWTFAFWYTRLVDREAATPSRWPWSARVGGHRRRARRVPWTDGDRSEAQPSSAASCRQRRLAVRLRHVRSAGAINRRRDAHQRATWGRGHCGRRADHDAERSKQSTPTLPSIPSARSSKSTDRRLWT